MRFHDIAETLRNLKHKKSGFQLCPKCGSPSILGVGSLDGWLLPTKFTCEDCGYSGYLLMELDESKEPKKEN
jgi:predicted RNA-binding Zn-ribbon protein involved in translation (DUF1610 family)